MQQSTIGPNVNKSGSCSKRHFTAYTIYKNGAFLQRAYQRFNSLKGAVSTRITNITQKMCAFDGR